MKSVAFNLAFKVHRNELPFAEGLVKAVEEQAQEDFIQALNSLAGETKYDVDQLDALVDEAVKGLNPDSSRPEVDVKALQEEVRRLRKKRKDLLDGIETLENQIATLVPSITPGINSFLLLMVGGVIFMILLIMKIGLAAVLILLGTLGGAIFFAVVDFSNLSRQKLEIERKKKRNHEEIKKIKTALAEFESTLEEKEQLLKSVQQQSISPHDPFASMTDPDNM
ncbi:MAG: hypothetical protein C4527_02205 [Candidatus Omnitrophota bacterium]|jgi:predicted nuclease with TOPRIM domain|nr:MAG: hypothetical protein C4527_02205 [Candidatus Omnitrophota bacterium]